MTWSGSLPATHIYRPAKAPVSFKRRLGGDLAVGHVTEDDHRQSESCNDYQCLQGEVELVIVGCTSLHVAKSQISSRFPKGVDPIPRLFPSTLQVEQEDEGCNENECADDNATEGDVLGLEEVLRDGHHGSVEKESPVRNAPTLLLAPSNIGVRRLIERAKPRIPIRSTWTIHCRRLTDLRLSCRRQSAPAKTSGQ
jgi:hypothetical protein